MIAFILILASLVLGVGLMVLLALLAVGRESVQAACRPIGHRMTWEGLSELSVAVLLALVCVGLSLAAVIEYGVACNKARKRAPFDARYGLSYGFAVGFSCCTMLILIALMLIRCRVV